MEAEPPPNNLYYTMFPQITPTHTTAQRCRPAFPQGFPQGGGAFRTLRVRNAARRFDARLVRRAVPWHDERTGGAPCSATTEGDRP